MAEVLDYGQLDLHSLSLSDPLDCSLYIRKKQEFVLYCEANLSLSRSDCERLLANGVTALWVPLSEPARSPANLVGLLARPDDEIPSTTKAGLLYASAKSIVHRAFSDASKENIEEVENLVGTTIDYLTGNEAAYSVLLSVILHDFSTFTHAVNVAFYSIGLGRHMGVTNMEDLRDLGVGAILHDVGKTKVPTGMLNKLGAFVPEEWIIMRKHPVWGIELLKERGELSDTSLEIVVQHHERLDGSGYPNGLSEKDLHPFSMIVSLVDAYDAMTCQRPYRPPRSPYNALLELKKEAGEKYSYELYANLVSLLGNP